MSAKYFIAELNSGLLTLRPPAEYSRCCSLSETHSYKANPQKLAALTQAISGGGQRQLKMRYDGCATPSVKRVCCWLRRNPGVTSNGSDEDPSGGKMRSQIPSTAKELRNIRLAGPQGLVRYRRRLLAPATSSDPI